MFYWRKGSSLFTFGEGEGSGSEISDNPCVIRCTKRRQKGYRAYKINVGGIGSLEGEITKQKSEAEALAGEIEELTGQSPAMEAKP